MKHVSVEELATVLGVEKDLLLNLAKEGVLPKFIDGEYYSAEIAVLAVEAIASSVVYRDGKVFLSKPKIKAYLSRFLGGLYGCDKNGTCKGESL